MGQQGKSLQSLTIWWGLQHSRCFLSHIVYANNVFWIFDWLRMTDRNQDLVHSITYWLQPFPSKFLYDSPRIRRSYVLWAWQNIWRMHTTTAYTALRCHNPLCSLPPPLFCTITTDWLVIWMSSEHLGPFYVILGDLQGVLHHKWWVICATVCNFHLTLQKATEHHNWRLLWLASNYNGMHILWACWGSQCTQYQVLEVLTLQCPHFYILCLGKLPSHPEQETSVLDLCDPEDLGFLGDWSVDWIWMVSFIYLYLLC